MSRPLPGHRVQLDVKFIAPLAGSRRKHYQFTAIDDCTRMRVLRIYPQLNQKTAIQFADYVLERLPFRVEVIQTDNGVEFGASFHWHVLDKGIGHDYIKPRTPRLNGKVERSHRIDAEEFYQLLDGVVIDDTEVFNDKLREWENFYNYHRPHGGLGGQTPYERLKQRTQTRGTPEPPGIPGRFSLAWPPPPRPVALHPDLRLVVEPGRGVLLDGGAAGASPRRLRQRR
jgi:transposase InsO family protein